MADSDSTPVRLTKGVLEAGADWRSAKLKLDQAKLDYDYAEQRLVLRKRELRMEQERWEPPEWGGELEAEFGDTTRMHDRLRALQLVGEPIGRASRSVLQRMEKATVEQLAEAMRQRSFEFSSGTPARELHGALVKQPWAKKNPKTDEWEYVMGE